MFPRWHLTLQLRGNLLFFLWALCTRDSFTFFICILPLFFLSSATRSCHWRCFSIILLLLTHITGQTQISADVIITALNILFKLCWHVPLNASKLVLPRFLSSVYTCTCLFFFLFTLKQSTNVKSKVSKQLGFEISSGLLFSRCMYSLSHKSKNNPSEHWKFFFP